VNGWIDTLYADTNGMLVKKDQPLFELYSRSSSCGRKIDHAVRAFNRSTQRRPKPFAKTIAVMVDSARRKLRLWDVAEQDIVAIAHTEHAPRTVMFEVLPTGTSWKRNRPRLGRPDGDELMRIEITQSYGSTPRSMKSNCPGYQWAKRLRRRSTGCRARSSRGRCLSSIRIWIT